jgi:hypothetical protein
MSAALPDGCLTQHKLWLEPALNFKLLLEALV